MPRTSSAADESYDLKTPTGMISGSLVMPAKVVKPPVVLIIAGSGPTDRNCNGPQLRTDAYRLLAQSLEDRGIASVRYDKRGIAGSAAALASESDIRFDDYVNDAAGWIRQMRADRRFGRVAIAGHSEGSLIGMIAAEQAPVDAFATLEGVGFPAPAVIRRQLRPKLANLPDLNSANERILNELSAGRTIQDVPNQLLALYRPSIQSYLIAWFRYDPRVEIAKLQCSVTIVQGTADIQVTVEDAKALAAVLPAAKLVIVNGLSHVLKQAPDPSPDAQLRTVYSDPSLPIDDTVPSAITNALS
jgi:pimeloyl-ACP methyl ester carboxylesterase